MGLEPFTVVCPTCQSRIRVRNPALIGQLANCPKCRSMVLIQPTSSAGAGKAAGGVDSRALTKDGLEAEPGRARDDSAETKDAGLASSFSDSLTKSQPDDPDDTAKPNDRSAKGGDSSSLDFSKSDSQPAAYWSPPQRAAPTESWTSEDTNRKRQILLVGFFGLTSVAVSLVLLLTIMRWYRADNQPDRLALSGGPANPDDAVDADAPWDIESDESDSRDEDPKDDKLKVTDPDGRAPDINNRDNSQMAEKPTATVPDSELPSASELSLQSKTREMVVEDPKAAASDQDPATELTQDDLASIAADGQVDAADSDSPELADPAEGLPKQLRELAELLAQPFELTTPQTLTLPDRPPVTAEELGLASNLGERSLPPVDVHVLSQERLVRGLRMADIPPAHAINFLCLVSGIPGKGDLRSMAASNRDFRSPISFLLESGSIAELAQQFVQQVGLKLQSVDNRYWRFFSELPDTETLPWQYPVDDLLQDDTDAEWFQKTLNVLFPGASHGIQLSEGRLSADPDSVDRLDWFDVLRWIENWRTLRGLPSQLTKYPPENLRLPFVQPQQVSQLEQPLRQITTSPQALASFLSTQCSEAGLSCWIDWPALAEIGLSPSTPIVSVTFNRPLQNVLAELAFEFGITTVIIDEQTLWITQRNAYRLDSEVLVIPSDGRDADYWHQFLRPLTPVSADGVHQIQLSLTPDGNYVMVRCCRPTLEFN